jgi:hypothetical protein
MPEYKVLLEAATQHDVLKCPNTIRFCLRKISSDPINLELDLFDKLPACMSIPTLLLPY